MKGKTQEWWNGNAITLNSVMADYMDQDIGELPPENLIDVPDDIDLPELCRIINSDGGTAVVYRYGRNDSGIVLRIA